jgi:hypothetical protein
MLNATATARHRPEVPREESGDDDTVAACHRGSALDNRVNAASRDTARINQGGDTYLN